jgi:selT/selW/selH-like putative selenoprotein
LAEEIEKEFATEVELEPGEFHSFDVLVDGNLIFSKSEAGRFPEPEEIFELIRAYLDRK